MNEDDLIGIEFDEYRLETLLGEGGMARVYRARDRYLQRYAAIKVISPTFREDPDYLKRFEREARAIASLEHPHVVRLYRYGEANGLLYMAMQFIEGSDLGSVLRSYCNSDEYIEYTEAVRLIREVGEALDYVHAQGIIHRDVKSSNVMLDRTGRAYLADFGLALLTQVGTRGEIFGSPHYLAPEQAISSAKAVPQSDLYSLGVIAWEMFVGQLPFDAEDPLEVAMQHMTQEPPRPRDLRPELPADLEAVLLKALAKKPEERYQSGSVMAAAIAAAVSSPATEASVAPPTSKTIPERVALDMADRPLPPVPAAVTPPPPDLAKAQDFALPPVSPQPSPHQRTSPPSLGGSLPLFSIATILMLCVLCGCLATFVLIPAGWSGLQLASLSTTPAVRTDSVVTFPSSPTAPQLTAQATLASTRPSATPTATRASVRATATSTFIPDPSPTLTSSPTSLPVHTVLLITRCKDGHCIGLINQGPANLSLDRLKLEADDLEIEDSDWGVASLPPGGCLVLTGNANRWAPTEAACQDLAATLVSDEDFWKEKLELSYADRDLGKCDKKSDTCEFVIPVR